jgi:hypothetical protein
MILEPFNLGPTSVMTLQIQQESGFSGVSFYAPATINLFLGEAAADEIVDSGPGTAFVHDSGIQIFTNGDNYLTPGNYTLISVPSGGLDGITLDTIPTVTVGGANYFFSLTDTNTSVVLTVSVPEPGSAAVAAFGSYFLLSRRRRRAGAR